ncbi:GNAT family N-acetyltransferase [Sphingobacterium sp. MYb382]|uniref:GNAT family N-acetyltransferase n=1 Tax=Sphingobacterium sp. MYb382 TaxID=2745278 RepID=UPI0030A1938D
MYIRIETDRLAIRPVVASDSEFMFRIMNAKGWLNFIGDRGIRETADAAAYIEKLIEDPNFYYHVFENKITAQAMGLITFIYRDTLDFPDIGFALLPEFGKKGYAYEAARAYLDILIHENVSSKILGITDPDNVNSIKLLERLGLEQVWNEEATNDLLTYSITIVK